MTGHDAIIIGGGLHGCSAALHLAMAGAKTLVIEKDYPGRHASGVNAGGVRRLARDLREVALSVESRKLWQNIGMLVDDDCGFHVTGHVQIAEGEDEFEEQIARVATLRANGHTHEKIIDAGELQDIVPAAAHQLFGGIHSAEDGVAMPYQTTLAFRRKAASLGVDFVEGSPVVGIDRHENVWSVETGRGERMAAPVLVNCAGAWAGAVCDMVGDKAPVDPIAPMLMITAAIPAFVRPVVSAARRVLSFKQFDNGTVLIGGGHTGWVDIERNRANLDFAKLAVNAGIACDLFPVMERAPIVRAWAGIEARMPDDLPVIGPSHTREGLFHAFGFSAHGFQLGPIVGRCIARLVGGDSVDVDLAPFSIARFSAQA